MRFSECLKLYLRSLENNDCFTVTYFTSWPGSLTPLGLASTTALPLDKGRGLGEGKTTAPPPPLWPKLGFCSIQTRKSIPSFPTAIVLGGSQDFQDQKCFSKYLVFENTLKPIGRQWPWSCSLPTAEVLAADGQEGLSQRRRFALTMHGRPADSKQAASRCFKRPRCADCLGGDAGQTRSNKAGVSSVRGVWWWCRTDSEHQQGRCFHLCSGPVASGSLWCSYLGVTVV